MTAYDRRMSDWSSDVCSSDLVKLEPYPYYVELRRNEPVKWLPGLQAYGVARDDDIDALLKDGRTFSSQQFWPALLGEYDPLPEEPPMISMDPPRHMQLRKLANKAFVPSKVNELKERDRKSVV